MRGRSLTLIALVLALFVIALPAAAFAAERAVLAQGTSGEEETEGEEPSEEGSDEGEVSEGQTEPEAETGSEEADTGEATAETGPPWTYQMGRIALALSALLVLAIIRMYYKLVVSRQKGAV